MVKAILLGEGALPNEWATSAEYRAGEVMVPEVWLRRVGWVPASMLESEREANRLLLASLARIHGLVAREAVTWPNAVGAVPTPNASPQEGASNG